MKAFLAFAIEAFCFVGILYFYIQNRKKEKAKKKKQVSVREVMALSLAR